MNPLTFNTVAGLLERDFRVAPDHIRPGQPLDGLGLDALSLLEFVFAAEDAFRLHIPAQRLDPYEAGLTLRGLCETIDYAMHLDGGAAEAPAAASVMAAAVPAAVAVPAFVPMAAAVSITAVEPVTAAVSPTTVAPMTAAAPQTEAAPAATLP
jgi:acyl carrier protein